jgi:hypothetical protein
MGRIFRVKEKDSLFELNGERIRLIQVELSDGEIVSTRGCANYVLTFEFVRYPKCKLIVQSDLMKEIGIKSIDNEQIHDIYMKKKEDTPNYICKTGEIFSICGEDVKLREIRPNIKATLPTLLTFEFIEHPDCEFTITSDMYYELIVK